MAGELDWAYGTVKTTMDRMVGKGLLEIEKVRNLQLFSAKVERRQAAKWEFRRMLARAFDGALGPMMQYLVENEELTREDLGLLRRAVDAGMKKNPGD